MTRKWDPELEQYRDKGKFASNDGATASGGMNALAESSSRIPPGRGWNIDEATHMEHPDGSSTIRTPKGDTLRYDSEMRLHSMFGPAIESPNGNEYHLFGKQFTREEFHEIQSHFKPHVGSSLDITGYIGEDGATVYQLDTQGDGEHVRFNVNDSTAWDGVVGQDGPATSSWACPDHPGETASCTFEDIAESGTPICGDCGNDMDLNS